MANFRSYKTDDGKKRILAVVRIKGFNTVRKAFGSRRDASDWAGATEKELREQRDRGGARPDLGTLTLRQLIEAFVADSKVKQRRYHSELVVMLAAWSDEYGSDRVRGFGREARRAGAKGRRLEGRHASRGRAEGEEPRNRSTVRPRAAIHHGCPPASPARTRSQRHYRCSTRRKCHLHDGTCQWV